MHSKQPLGRFSLSIAVLVFLAAGSLPPAAQSGSGKQRERPATLGGNARLQVQKIQNQLRNARSRVDNGVIGVGVGGDDGRTRTYGERRCGKNIERISKATLRLSALVDELESCYAASDVVGQETNIEYVRNDIALIRARLDDLAAAGDGAALERSLTDVTRAFFGLKKDVDPLPDCGGVAEVERALGQ